MNVRLYDGTVRCPACFDASTYQAETSDPCLYCHAAPEPTSDDQTWAEAQSALVVDPPKRSVQMGKRPCDWCWQPATWKILDDCALNGHQFACTDHGTEWYPELFGAPPIVQHFQVSGYGERELITHSHS
jgi:hypothetical protein